MIRKFSIARGTKDILPSEIDTWRRIEQRSRDLLHRYNYKEIRTPYFEETELFARSMGQTSDVVQKQMLNLASQHKESNQISLSGLSLRPENTASVVRSYIENNMDRVQSLSKLFYVGPMFRGERPQKGRLRQFHQIGVEAIGPQTATPYLDAEVISLSVHLLRYLGVEDFKLKINTLGSQEDKAAFAEQLRFKLHDKINDICEDCRLRFNRNVFRILDCKEKKCQQVLRDIQIDHSYLCADSNLYYSEVKSTLRQLGIKYEECLNLVRGLDYYTHTVFEICCDSLGSQNALGAGGRYDNLVSQLGGPNVDAIGFALGLERILLSLPSQEAMPKKLLDVFIVTLDQKILVKSFKLLQSLRYEGVSVDMSFRTSSMKSQMRLANKMGARFVILLGEEEMERKIITLKDMMTSQQQELGLGQLKKVVDVIKKENVCK